MKFFVDTADIKEIRDLAATGLLDGVTTNPSLIAKSGRPIKEVIKEICDMVEGPVSAEVAATEFDGMMGEGTKLAADRQERRRQGAADLDGLKACRALRQRGHQGQRHALLLGQPGAARRQGRRDLHLALRRPPRRHRLSTAWS